VLFLYCLFIAGGFFNTGATSICLFRLLGYQAGEIVRGPYEIGQNVEAIEMLPSDNNKLLLNTHNAGQLKMLDLISGELTLKSDKIKAYRDIEALAACGPV